MTVIKFTAPFADLGTNLDQLITGGTIGFALG